jgi:hypothetical protein
MTKLLKKEVKFRWDEKCKEAFHTLRKLLTTAPVLAQPDNTQPFDVYCDASGTGLGCVLMQNSRVIAYCGRTNLDYTGSSTRVHSRGLQHTSNDIIPWPVG